MHHIDRADRAPEEFARHLAEQQASMQAARGFVYLAHSHSGLLARFLQRMADRIDPTGEARSELRPPRV